MAVAALPEEFDDEEEDDEYNSDDEVRTFAVVMQFHLTLPSGKTMAESETESIAVINSYSCTRHPDGR